MAPADILRAARETPTSASVDQVKHDLFVALANLLDLCEDVFVKPNQCDDVIAARAAIAAAEAEAGR